MNKKLYLLIIFTAIISLTVSISYLTLAQTTSTTNITFPITSLGSCENQTACKAYCDKPENIEACVQFAEENNLMTQEEADNALKFADIAKNGGPGICKTKKDCESYCADANHLEECLSVAEKYNIISKEDIKEARQVLQALKSGKKLPGSCKNKNECDNYCSKSENMEECLGFAEAAGILSDKELLEAKQVLLAIKKGINPPPCRGKEACNSYCAEPRHFDECMQFAEAAGFISPEEAAMAKKTGGKGPGDCTSKVSCDEYCNKPENQEACFNFAKEHNLIPEEQLREIKNGMGRLRSGIKQAPPEVVSCLKDNLGQNIIEKIEAGTLTPGPQIGETVKSCFDQFMPKVKEQIQAGLKQATPETLQCLKDGLGRDGFAKIQSGKAPTPEMGDVMKNCFEAMKDTIIRKAKGELQAGLEKMSPEMKNCAQKQLGQELFDKIQNGTLENIGSEEGDKIKSAMIQCAQQFKPMMPAIPAEAESCLREIYGADFMGKLQNGETQPPEDMKTKIESCITSKLPPAPVPQIPAEAATCIKQIYDTETASKILSGETMPPADMSSKIEACVRQKMMPRIPQ